MSISNFKLNGRRALVTGGNRGIGKAIAQMLAEAGAEVAICARDPDVLKIAASEIEEVSGSRVSFFPTDMTDRIQVRNLARDVLAKMGGLDILVNNAGGSVAQHAVDTTDEAWDRIIELNLTSSMSLTRAFAPGMIERKWGRIIHITSAMAVGGGPGRGAYCASKSALYGMARAHALDLGPSGITVNCLAPGPVFTDMPARMLSPDQKATFAKLTALDKWGTPMDMAGPVLLLASDAGAYITGAMLVADGGMLIKTFS